MRAGKLKKSRYKKKELSSQYMIEKTPDEEAKQENPEKNQPVIDDSIVSPVETKQEPDLNSSVADDDEILAIFNDLGGNI